PLQLRQRIKAFSRWLMLREYCDGAGGTVPGIEQSDQPDRAMLHGSVAVTDGNADCAVVEFDVLAVHDAPEAGPVLVSVRLGNDDIEGGPPISLRRGAATPS